MLRSVLVPIDDSQPSRAALEHALSSYPDAEITALYVVDTTTPVGYGDLFTLAARTDRQSERGEELFGDAERLAEEHEADLTTVTEHGVPARRIARFVDEEGIDHVVMGSHGRTGVNRLFLGSVAERVVRRTSVPVTVVP